jgi:hypothetical protein
MKLTQNEAEFARKTREQRALERAERAFQSGKKNEETIKGTTVAALVLFTMFVTLLLILQ